MLPPPTLWKELARWLDRVNGGARGISTIRPHPRHTYIGYPLSQALFRQSDRNRLSYLFDRLGFEPHGGTDETRPTAAELVANYRLWAPSKTNLSPGAQLLAKDETFIGLLEDILVDALARWDGSLRGRQGERRARFVVALEVGLHFAVGFIAQRPEGFPVEFITPDLDPPGCLKSTVPGWYNQSRVELTESRLKEGFEAPQNGFALEYRPSEVVPLQETLEVGCWTSVRSVSAGRPHYVLAALSAQERLEQFLHAHAEVGWAQDRRSRLLPSGWLLYRGHRH